MDQVQMIREFLRAMRRHTVVILAVVCLGVVGSIYFALGRQSLYETSAKVLIESQQIPDDLARSTVNLTTSERLQLIEQRLMARDNLVGMIEKLGLFADAPDMPITKKVDALRLATHFNSITAPTQTYGNAVNVFAFTVTVQLGDREQAAAVANEFVDSAIEQNLSVRSQRVKETLAYFEQEDKRVGQAIAELEVKIAHFKRDNPEALPESLEFRREELRRSQERDLEIDASLLQLEESRAALNLALIGEAPAGMGIVAATPAETELGRLEVELAQKRKVLAPNHPDIRRLTSQLAAVTALVEQAPTDKKQPDAAPPPRSALNQAQQTAIRRQLSQIDAQIQLLKDQKASLADRRLELGNSIRDTPQAEITLNGLTRQLAELQEQYAIIVQRRAEASTGQQLEASEQSERFHILERALVPDYPVSPNRKKLVVMGSAASVGLAVGIVFLLELLHPVLRTSAQMERQLNLRPVITIPFVPTPGDRRRRRLVQIALLSVIIAAGIAGSVAIDKQRHSPEPLSIRDIFASVGLASKD